MTRGLRTCLSRLIFLVCAMWLLTVVLPGSLVWRSVIIFRFFSSFLGWESVSKFPLHFSRPLGKYLVTMAFFQDPTAPPSFIALSPLISYPPPPPPPPPPPITFTHTVHMPSCYTRLMGPCMNGGAVSYAYVFHTFAKNSPKHVIQI